VADVGVAVTSRARLSFAALDPLWKLSWPLASAVFGLGLWSLVVLTIKPKPYVLPAPWDVLARMWTDRILLLTNGASTLEAIFVGLFIGVIVAIPLGIAIVAIPVAEKLFYPQIVAFNAIPKVALAPLFVVWFGYGFLPRVLITTSIAFFPILVSTITGLMSIDPELLRLAKVLRGETFQIFLRMRLPQALPTIFAGIKVGTGLAVIGAILGEFIASDEGWGYLLLKAGGVLDTDIMFAVVIILAVVASLLFSLVAVIERSMVSWHASQR
jgi:NitT/TauT family transport system permease protein